MDNPSVPRKLGSTVYRNGFRLARMRMFLELADAVLATKPSCRVLDVGGEVGYWNGLRDAWSGRRLEITIVNIAGNENNGDATFDLQAGDARNLGQFADGSFDVVHSNSVIEHVGQWADMQSMAREVRRLAPRYFVQTPNFWFPQEPHLRVPMIHWMPQPWRREIVMRRRCGFYPRARSVAEANAILSDASLLDAPAMTALFPDAHLVRERFGPLTKSLIAVKAAS